MTNPKSLANLKPIKPGETRNPGGKVKGTRDLLGRKFCDDLLRHYTDNGKDAIEKVFQEDTTQYLKLVAAAGLPTQLETSPGESVLDGLTPDQVTALLSAVRLLEQLEARAGDAPGEASAPGQPPFVH
ncbi:MAG: hypothetical protein U0835_00245 [Isosphaeraceae bacterium]